MGEAVGDPREESFAGAGLAVAATHEFLLTQWLSSGPSLLLQVMGPTTYAAQGDGVASSELFDYILQTIGKREPPWK